MFRIEVSNCHVFLLELPGLEGNPAYHIESAIRIRDSRITSGLPVDMLQELLDHPALDKFEAFLYDPISSLFRLEQAYAAAFCPARLQHSVRTYSLTSPAPVVRWTNVLDAIYRLNLLSSSYPNTWSAPLPIFEHIFQIESPFRRPS